MLIDEYYIIAKKYGKKSPELKALKYKMRLQRLSCDHALELKVRGGYLMCRKCRVTKKKV